MAYKIIKGSNKITGNQTFTNNISASVVSASYFVGDGSLLTNISASNSGSGAATGQGPENSVQFKSGSSGAISGSSNLLFDYTIPKFTANSGFVVNRVSSSTNITLSPAQHIIGINTLSATASITITLPNASSLSNGQMFIIKDEGGNANINTIILSCSINGQTIDGESTILIESPYSAVNLYCDGNSKYYIY
jgi:hypothetical protein